MAARHSRRRLQSDVVLKLELGLIVAVPWFEVDGQSIFDGKNRVVVQVFRLLVENLRCDGLEILGSHLSDSEGTTMLATKTFI